MFTPVDPAIKERVISAYLAGKGRNQIDRELHEKGIKVSHGSISNIINTYKRKHEQPLQSDISGTEQTVITPRDGGPLSNFLNEDVNNQPVNDLNNFEQKDSVQKQEFEDIDFENTAVDPEIFNNPEIPYDPKLDGLEGERYFTHTPNYPNVNPLNISQQVPEFRRLEIKAIDNYKHVTKETEEVEEASEESNQPQSSIRNSENQSTLVEIDWDKHWESRFWARIMEEKEEKRNQLMLIEQEFQELEKEKQQLEQIRNNIEQQKRDLKVMENRLIEYEPLIPSVKELQDWGITFTIIFPYIMAIHQKAIEENIDLKTSASNLVHDIRENRRLETLQSTIKHLEERVSALNELNTQKQAAVVTLMNLQMMGYSKKDIMELIEVVNRWNGDSSLGTPGMGQGNGHKKLDTKLIGCN
jgi:hypothetical protein